jgi:hypothetical protein
MNRHDLEKLNVAYNQVHEKKDSSYLETDMKKRQENNEKARKDMAKVKGQKNPHFESVEVEEEKKELPKNKMFRKAGNLGREVVSPSVTDDQRQKAYDRSKKIVKTLNKENQKEEVDSLTAAYNAVYEVEEAEQRMKAKGSDKKMKVMPDAGPAYIKKPKDYVKNEETETVAEDDKSYDRNRKRAAQRAADRNAARAAGKTGVVPGVGYVTARKEKESYTDSKGVERHKSGAKNEEVNLEDNPVYEATKADIKEFVGAMIGNAVNATLANPVGAGLAAGTVGAVTGGKKKVKKSLATGAGAATGAALGGLPGAVIGGIAGNALS